MKNGYSESKVSVSTARKYRTVLSLAFLFTIWVSACSPLSSEAPIAAESTNTLVPTSTITSTATPVPNTYPDARGFGQLVYHPPTGQLILIGGEANARFSYEETWSFDTNTNIWTDLNPETQPLNKTGEAAAYDSESDRIIVYFSTRLSDTDPSWLKRLSQTWAYDLQSNTWTNMMPDPAPFGLMGARLAYDTESDRIILFGGADFTVFPGPPYFEETWAYGYNTNTWQKMQSSGEPLRRTYFGFAYSPVADRVSAFGGNLHEDDGAREGEMWAYDYNNDSWSQVSYTGEVLDDHHPELVYDPNSDRFLYYVKDKFWEFDLAQGVWAQLERIPESRNRHFLAMAFDSAADKLVIFGGGPAGLTYDDSTWIYDVASSSWTRLELPGNDP